MMERQGQDEELAVQGPRAVPVCVHCPVYTAMHVVCTLPLYVHMVCTLPVYGHGLPCPWRTLALPQLPAWAPRPRFPPGPPRSRPALRLVRS